MKDFIQLLKLPPSILVAVAMGTGLILFLPISILQRLGLDNIPEQWRTILGFVASYEMWLSAIIKSNDEYENILGNGRAYAVFCQLNKIIPYNTEIIIVGKEVKSWQRI